MFLRSITFIFLFFIFGCASSRRMTRVSPFTDIEKESSSERVNLWPIAYKNGEELSIIWPIYDQDEKGYAIRPIFVKDENDYGLLFPLSGWTKYKKGNKEYTEGWFLTTYWGENVIGTFPIFNKSEDFNYYFPIWWGRNSAKDPIDSAGLLFSGKVKDTYFLGPLWYNTDNKTGYGVFPILQLGNSDENWIFPLYSSDIRKDGETHKLLFGLLANLESNKDGYDNMFFPVFWKKDKDSKRFMIFPITYNYSFDNGSEFMKKNWTLLYYNESDNKKHRNILAPLYYYNNDYEKNKLFFTLLGGFNKTKTQSDYWFLNFWSRYYQSGAVKSSLFPFYYYNNTLDKKALITPIGAYSHSNKDSWNLFLNYYNRYNNNNDYMSILFPFYYYNKKDGKKVLITPLGSIYNDNFETSKTILTYLNRENDKIRYNAIFPFYLYRKDKIKKQTTLFTPIYSTLLENENGNSFTNVLLFLYHSSTNKKNKISKKDFLWPLYSSYKSPEERKLYSFPLFYFDKNFKTGDYTNSFLLGLVNYGKNNQKEHISVIPFYDKNIDKKTDTESETICLLIQSYKDKKSSDFYFFPFYSNSNNKTEYNESVFLPTLINYSTFIDGYNYHIFPFISSKNDFIKKTKTNSFLCGLSEFTFNQNKLEKHYIFPIYSRKYNVPTLISSYDDEWNVLGPFIAEKSTFYNYYDQEFNYNIQEKLFSKIQSTKKSFYYAYLMHILGKETRYNNIILPLKNNAITGSRGEKADTEPCVKSESSSYYFLFWRFTKNKYLVWDKESVDYHDMIDLYNEQDKIITKRIKVNNEFNSMISDNPDYCSGYDKNKWGLDEKESMKKIKDIFSKYNKEIDTSSMTSMYRSFYDFSKANTNTVSETSLSLQPLFKYTSFPYRSETNFDLLLFLLNYEKFGNLEKFSILKYLYRSTTKDDVVRKDIFPFITYDSSKDKTKFSFFWRMINIEKSKKGIKGHLLFIPFHI